MKQLKLPFDSPHMNRSKIHSTITFYRTIHPEKRKRILKRDGYKCYTCGTKRRELEVHHSIPAWKLTKEEIGKEENLITLCKRCHRKVEFGKTDDIMKIMMDAAEQGKIDLDKPFPWERVRG